MIKCKGTLRIKRIHQSRNGAFCIGDLATDFGEFKVKDPMLDQFNEGEYEGTIWISEIYLAQYISYGKAITELRARLHDLQVDTEDRSPVRSAEQGEPDPADEVPTPKVPVTPHKKAAKGTDWANVKGNRLSKGKASEEAEPEASSTDSTSGKSDASANAVFSDDLRGLVETKQPVKLDPTVDRVLLRQQAAALHKLGYEFKAQSQTWYHQAS